MSFTLFAIRLPVTTYHDVAGQHYLQKLVRKKLLQIILASNGHAVRAALVLNGTTDDIRVLQTGANGHWGKLMNMIARLAEHAVDAPMMIIPSRQAIAGLQIQTW